MLTRKEQLEKLLSVEKLIWDSQDRVYRLIQYQQNPHVINRVTDHEIDIAIRAHKRLKQWFNYLATSMPLYRTNPLPTVEREPFTNA